MAKITQPKTIKKRKNLGEAPDTDTRLSVNKHIRDEAEFKRYPKPEIEQKKKGFVKTK